MNRMLTFDDVALQPYYNNVESRGEPTLDTWLTSNIRIRTPLLASPMSSVIGDDLAEILVKRGSMPVYHRFTTEEQIGEWLWAGQGFISWGVNDVEKLIQLIDDSVRLGRIPVRGICFDVAHGHSLKMKYALELFKSTFPDIDVIAGSVCTEQAVNDLVTWGADAIRVGIGPGAACTTRTVTGFGAPQFTTIQDCARAGKRRKVPIIADGGIRSSRDVVLALAAGASTVMLGKMFAACEESAAEKAKIHPMTNPEGVSVALYKGQASEEFQREGVVPEGEGAWIPVTGSANDLMDKLEAGIRSGMTYGGARTIKELQEHAIFVEVTSSYWDEMRTRFED